jgi:hypothetical protein
VWLTGKGIRYVPACPVDYRALRHPARLQTRGGCSRWAMRVR